MGTGHTRTQRDPLRCGETGPAMAAPWGLGSWHGCCAGCTLTRPWEVGVHTPYIHPSRTQLPAHTCAHSLQHSRATQCTQTLHGPGARPHTHVCAHTAPVPWLSRTCAPQHSTAVCVHTHTPHSSAQPHTHTLTHLHGVGAHTHTHTHTCAEHGVAMHTHSPWGLTGAAPTPAVCTQTHAPCRAPSLCACTTRTPFAHVPARPTPGTRCPT